MVTLVLVFVGAVVVDGFFGVLVSSSMPALTAAKSALLIDVCLVRWVVGVNAGADADSINGGVVFGPRGGVALGVVGAVVLLLVSLTVSTIVAQFMPVVLGGGGDANLSW